ncbi:2-oxoglutarate-dependent dioxygenase gloF [Fusarium oxysporum f. sp. albedinis]|nr:2-oxoglutarate-dependent dioxygenase gloF [Fusarium oxysporum f. sp. albedinis]
MSEKGCTIQGGLLQHESSSWSSKIRRKEDRDALGTPLRGYATPHGRSHRHSAMMLTSSRRLPCPRPLILTKAQWSSHQPRARLSSFSFQPSPWEAIPRGKLYAQA